MKLLILDARILHLTRIHFEWIVREVGLVRTQCKPLILTPLEYPKPPHDLVRRYLLSGYQYLVIPLPNLCSNFRHGRCVAELPQVRVSPWNVERLAITQTHRLS